MNDIKKVLIVAICVVLVIAIAAGVSIGVMANTMNGLKDRVEELDQAYASDMAAMKAEIEAAKAANENLVTAADFEAKLAAAIGEQNQTMQSLISTAVKNQIEDLEVEGLTEEQVNAIIDAAVANCLTEADVDAMIADIDTGLTKAEVKKLITDNTAGYLTYAQIMNLIEDEAYDLRAFLEAQINGLGTSVANKTTKITLNASDYTADCTLTATQLDNIVSGGTIILKGNWSTKTLYINYAGAKDFVIDVTGIDLNTLNINAPKCHVELTGTGATIGTIIATVASNSLVITGDIAIGEIEITTGRVVVGEDASVVNVTIEGSDVTLENKGDIDNVNVNAEGAVITNDTDATIGKILVDEDVDLDEIEIDEDVEDKITLGWDGETVKAPAYDEASKTYTINNAAELAWIAEAGKTFEGETFELTVNIDLDGKAWTPIGSKETPFAGIFDGNAYTIYNLTVKADNAAMFAYINNATVKNVNFENVAIDGKNAAVAVTKAENSTIENIYAISGTVDATEYGAGIVMQTASTTISNCQNDADVNAGEWGAGGIGAWIIDSTVSGCVNNGTIVGGNRAAGICGNFSGTMTDCENNGDVTSNGGMPAGGIVGVASGAITFTDCVNNGDVTTTVANDNASAAGILGQTPSAKVTITNCVNTGDITAEQSIAAGIGVSLYGGITATDCTNEGKVSYKKAAGSADLVATKGVFGGSNTVTTTVVDTETETEG